MNSETALALARDALLKHSGAHTCGVVGPCPGPLATALVKSEKENEKMRTAIQRALDDEESGTGWGPDVTVCKYLRDALPKGKAT